MCQCEKCFEKFSEDDLYEYLTCHEPDIDNEGGFKFECYACGNTFKIYVETIYQFSRKKGCLNDKCEHNLINKVNGVNKKEANGKYKKIFLQCEKEFCENYKGDPDEN
jgi:hypothetical protein